MGSFEIVTDNKSETMKRIVCSDDCMGDAVVSHVEAIVQLVDAEFGTKADLFTPVVVRMDARDATAFVAKKSPGVYVFIDGSGRCLKVGKSHLNASKRALEHCRDNTSSKDGTIRMADLVNSPNTYILVFALQGRDSLHWVLALEHFLEKALKPRRRVNR
jgi:hypothetical protein